MIYWNRFISYIYRYHNNEKSENTGFAKVQKASNTGKINIGLKDIMNRQDDVYSVYLYRETLPDEEDGGYTDVDNDLKIMIPKPIYIGKLKMRGGRGEGMYSFDWNNVKNSGRPITAWSGIAIKKITPGSGQYGKDIFCSSWTDSIVDYSYLMEEESEAESYGMKKNASDKAEEDMQAHRISVSGEQDGNHEAYASGEMNEEYVIPALEEPDTQYETPTSGEPDGGYEALISGETNEQYEAITSEDEDNTYYAEDVLKQESRYIHPAAQMLETYERLPLLPENAAEGSQVIECVKITPNDIGLLDMNNWRLGVNSFLTHGYYNYKYLMLGRIAFADNALAGSYVLGVPGVYSAKEKYLAGVFGFDRFVPCQETEIKTGSFGYWLVNII